MTNNSPSLAEGVRGWVDSQNHTQNLLFALLENVDSHTKSIERLYPCIYDISREILLPSVSHNDKCENLSQITPLKHLRHKPQEAFTHLESLTNDYRDISALKRIFANLITQLNAQIQNYDSRIEGSKQSDGGLFFIESKRFRLIAWLLINPDFSAPQFQNPQFQNPQKQNGGTK